MCSERFPFLVDCIAFLVSVNIFTTETIRNQFIYQAVSEVHNYTSNTTRQLCTVNASVRTHEEKVVADEVSRWSLWYNLASGLTALVAAFILTSWSDKVGRKLPLAISLVGLLISSILDALVVSFGLPIYVMVVDGVISGVCGSFPAFLYISLAYLSDTTGATERGKRYTIMESAVGIGGGLSAVGTGFWISVHGYIPSSVMAATSVALALLLVPLLSGPTNLDMHRQIPRGSISGDDEVFADENSPDYGSLSRNDTSSTRRRSKRELKKRNISFSERISTLWRISTTETSMCNICDEDDMTGLCNHGGGFRRGRLWRLWLYVVSFCLYVYALVGPSFIQTMYFLSDPLCFTPVLIGIQNGLRLCTVGLAPLLVYFYQSVMHLSNQTIIVSGIIVRLALSAIISFSGQPYLILIATGLAVFSNITTPFIRSQISNQVSASEQGITLGFVSCTESITDLLAMVSFLTIYPATMQFFRGFVWLLAAVVLCFPLILMTAMWIVDRRRIKNTHSSRYSAIG